MAQATPLRLACSFPSKRMSKKSRIYFFFFKKSQIQGNRFLISWFPQGLINEPVDRASSPQVMESGRTHVSFGLLSYRLPLRAVGVESLQQTDLRCDPAHLTLCSALPSYSIWLISALAALWRFLVVTGYMTVVCLTPAQCTARQCPQPRELQLLLSLSTITGTAVMLN